MAQHGLRVGWLLGSRDLEFWPGEEFVGSIRWLLCLACALCTSAHGAHSRECQSTSSALPEPCTATCTRLSLRQEIRPRVRTSLTFGGSVERPDPLSLLCWRSFGIVVSFPSRPVCTRPDTSNDTREAAVTARNSPRTEVAHKLLSARNAAQRSSSWDRIHSTGTAHKPRMLAGHATGKALVRELRLHVRPTLSSSFAASHRAPTGLLRRRRRPRAAGLGGNEPKVSPHGRTDDLPWPSAGRCACVSRPTLCCLRAVPTADNQTARSVVQCITYRRRGGRTAARLRTLPRGVPPDLVRSGTCSGGLLPRHFRQLHHERRTPNVVRVVRPVRPSAPARMAVRSVTRDSNPSGRLQRRARPTDRPTNGSTIQLTKRLSDQVTERPTELTGFSPRRCTVNAPPRRSSVRTTGGPLGHFGSDVSFEWQAVTAHTSLESFSCCRSASRSSECLRTASSMPSRWRSYRSRQHWTLLRQQLRMER